MATVATPNASNAAAVMVATPVHPKPLSISLESIPRLEEPAILVGPVLPGSGSTPEAHGSPTTAPSDEEEATPQENPPPRSPWTVTPEDASAKEQAEDGKEGEDGADEDDLDDPSSASGAKSSIRKQAWTNAEDATLLELVQRHGPSNWSRIAADLPSRIGKQCRERWHNHLSPAVKKEVSLCDCPALRSQPQIPPCPPRVLALVVLSLSLDSTHAPRTAAL